MVVGKNIPHENAIDHVKGTTEYVSDVAMLQNELFVDFFCSPIAKGEILDLNIEEAKKVPGVVEIYLRKDIPGSNKFGTITQDETFLASNKVEFVGQPIAIIAATSLKAIEKAKQSIKLELQQQKPILTIKEAIEAKQFIERTYVFDKGSVSKSFENAENIMEGTFCVNGQEHFYLETQSAIAYPDENGSIKVRSSTQNITGVQKTIAAILGIPLNQIIVESKKVGGAFGGKESQGAPIAAMVALVAFKTRKPARIVLSSEKDMKVTGKRHPFMNNYKVAFTNEGIITGLSVDLFSNGGYANDYSISVTGRSMSLLENAYYIENARITGTVCKTNLPPSTAFRGFGGPQSISTMESIIEDIAKFLNKDPFEIRRLNCYGIDKNNVTPYGQIVLNNTLPELMDTLVKTSNYEQRRKEILEFNKHSKRTIKGITLMPLKFGIGFEIRFINQASALVNIYLDGTIQVSTGGIEMGQGLNTKISQIVAEVFCISTDNIRVMGTSTEKNNNSSPTAASTGTDFNGGAALNACNKIKENLLEFASRYLYASSSSVSYINWTKDGIWDVRKPDKIIQFDELILNAYFDRVSLGERGFYQTPGIEFDWDTGKGTPFHYYTFGAAVTEVEIDKFTGVVDVKRADILMDIGNSINPGIDKGQIIGGYIQGLGWSIVEELKYNDNGELLTNSAATYKVPGVNDLPEIFNVNWIENDKNDINVMKNKAVGEPPFILGVSAWVAIKNALACIDSTVAKKLTIPATSEQVLLLLNSLNKQDDLANAEK